MNLAYVDSGSGSPLVSVVVALGALLFVLLVIAVPVQAARRRAERRQPPA